MAKVTSVAEIAENWVQGVAGKQDKYETNAKAGRATGLKGLASISGLTPGPKFTAAYNNTTKLTGSRWANGVAGKKDKFATNLAKAINQ